MWTGFSARTAGRYIDETATTTAGIFADYTRALNSRFAAALGSLPDARQGTTAANRESVLATWSLSVNHLVGSGYRQVPQIMNILSCLDPSGIPPSLISRVQDYLASPGATDLAAGPDLLATLRAMRNFGLVDFAPSQEKSLAVDNERVITDDSTMQVHRLVADVFDHALRGIPEEARPTYAATIKILVAVMTHVRKIGSAGILDASLVAPHCARVAHSASRSPELYDRGELRQFVKAIGGACELMFSFLPSSDSLGILQKFLTLAESVTRRHAKPVRQIRHSLAHEFWKAKQNDRPMRLLLDSQPGFYRLYYKLLPEFFGPQLASLHSFILPGAVGEMQADTALRTLRSIKRMPIRSTSNSLKHRYNLATTLATQGHKDIAEAEFRNIITAWGRRGPKYQLEELRVRVSLADALRGNGKLAESEQQYQEILGAADLTLPESDSIALGSRWGLAVILYLRGEDAAAADAFRQLLDIETRILGATDPSTISTRRYLADVLQREGDYDEAERLRRLVAADLRATANDERTRGTRHDLGHVLEGLGDLDGAAAEFRALVEFDEQHSPAEPTREAREDLIRVLKAQNDLAGLEVVHRALLAADLQVGPDTPRARTSRFRLGEVLAERGDLADAEAEFREVTRQLERALGSHDEQTVAARSVLIKLLESRSDLESAAAELENLVSAYLQVGPDEPRTRRARQDLGRVLLLLGKTSAAEAEFRAVVEFDERHPEVPAGLRRSAQEDMITVLQASGDLAGLAITINEASSGPASPETIANLRCLAGAMVETGRFSAAIAPLQRVLATDTERFGEHDEELLPTLTSLADALLALDDPAGALPYLERIVGVTERGPAPNYARQVAALRKFADVMHACNSGSEVIPVLERLVRLHDHYGAQTGEVAGDLRNLSQALLRHNQSQEAQSYLELAQDIDRRRKGRSAYE